MEKNKEKLWNKILVISIFVIGFVLNFFGIGNGNILFLLFCCGIIEVIFLICEDEMSREGKIYRTIINFIWILIIFIYRVVSTFDSDSRMMFETNIHIFKLFQYLFKVSCIVLLLVGIKRFIFRKKIDKYIVLNIFMLLMFIVAIFAFCRFAENYDFLFFKEETNSETFNCQDKPIIYLYPKQAEKISVKLGNPDILTCTYPKYDDGWTVLAEPNGNLVDLKTNRNLYALYWEGKSKNEFNVNEGFVVKGKESAEFLEEKLAILGLTDREIEEFIVYWLPQLEKNETNFIRFESSEEINEIMPLEITPKPDTLIRVYMVFKAVPEDYKYTNQKLENAERNGFVAVEWGGTNLDNKTE